MKLKRLCGMAIDYIIFFLIIGIPFIILWSTILRKTFDNATILIFVIMFAISVLEIILLCSKDFIIGFNSIGKKIMRLSIYKNGEIVTDRCLLMKRNYITVLTFPISLVTILLNNKSIGDYIMGTEVKSKK